MTENFVSYSGKKAFALIALLTVFVVTIPAQLSDAAPQVRAREFGFYGTNNADWVVLTVPTTDPNPFVWKVLKNPSSPLPGQAQIKQFNWGVFGDIVTPGPWTGDATYDAGIFRPGSVQQYWVVPTEAPATALITRWGQAADNLGREGDYDGDGIMDHTVIRITGGLLGWWIRLSSTGQLRVVNFGTTLTGTSLFAFRGADFTGDGRDEFTIARVVNATGATTWYVGDAVTGAQIYQVQWGNFNTHYLVNPADYTGDGRADIVTWAAGEQPANQLWWILNPFTNQRLPLQRFGIGDPNFITQDLPIRGDYDGDGIHDICVWRPNNATFYCQRSTDGALVIQQWGLPTDVPLATFFTF